MGIKEITIKKILRLPLVLPIALIAIIVMFTIWLLDDDITIKEVTENWWDHCILQK